MHCKLQTPAIIQVNLVSDFHSLCGKKVSISIVNKVLMTPLLSVPHSATDQMMRKHPFQTIQENILSKQRRLSVRYTHQFHQFHPNNSSIHLICGSRSIHIALLKFPSPTKIKIAFLLIPYTHSFTTPHCVCTV
jgi:hypothetical protein